MNDTNIDATPHCPLLFGTNENPQCHAKMTFHHFRSMCNTNMFPACIIYGATVKELKEPIEWLQHTAVNEVPLNKKEENKDDPNP